MSRFAALLLAPVGGMTAPNYSHFHPNYPLCVHGHPKIPSPHVHGHPKWSPMCSWSPKMTAHVSMVTQNDPPCVHGHPKWPSSVSMSPKITLLHVHVHPKWPPSMSVVTQNDPHLCPCQWPIPWSPKKWLHTHRRFHNYILVKFS